MTITEILRSGMYAAHAVTSEPPFDISPTGRAFRIAWESRFAPYVQWEVRDALTISGREFRTVDQWVRPIILSNHPNAIPVPTHGYAHKASV